MCEVGMFLVKNWWGGGGDESEVDLCEWKGGGC